MITNDSAFTKDSLDRAPKVVADLYEIDGKLLLGKPYVVESIQCSGRTLKGKRCSVIGVSADKPWYCVHHAHRSGKA